MEKGSSNRTHRLPVSRLNYNGLLKEMDEREAEQFRKRVMYLSDNLYDCTIKERVYYGTLAVLFIVGFYWDTAPLSDFGYYTIKIGLDLGLVVMSIASYIGYLNRLDAERSYWKHVFGDNYRG